MIFTYLKIVGAFVVSILTVYLLGTFTRAHRSSAVPVLIVGVIYGLIALNAENLAIRKDIWLLPTWLMDSYANALVGCLVTGTMMLGISMIKGWTPKAELFKDASLSDEWLSRSQKEITQKIEIKETTQLTSKIPILLGLSVWAIRLIMTFVVFW